MTNLLQEPVLRPGLPKQSRISSSLLEEIDEDGEEYFEDTPLSS